MVRRVLLFYIFPCFMETESSRKRLNITTVHVWGWVERIYVDHSMILPLWGIFSEQPRSLLSQTWVIFGCDRP